MLLSVLLLIFCCKSEAVPSKCCGSKTVGSYSYTLMDTNGNVPSRCKDSCTYTRDGDDNGSMFCFANGEQPVECQGEMAVRANYPREGGCPPKKNVKIGGPDAIPNTITERKDYTDCLDWCRYICVETIAMYNGSCQCEAWAWQASNNTCYTYQNDDYEAVDERGFWSGGLCLEANLTLETKTESMIGQLKFWKTPLLGNLKQATKKFNDYPLNPLGKKVTEIIVYLGKYFEMDIITGIQFYWGTTASPVHGNRGSSSKSFTVESNQVFCGIHVNYDVPEGYLSFLRRIGFYTYDGKNVRFTGYAGILTGSPITTYGKADRQYQMWFDDGMVTSVSGQPEYLGKIQFSFIKA